MVIRLGTNEPNKLYVGTQEVQKIYRGSGLVWSAVPIDPSGGPQSSGSGIAAPGNDEWSVEDGKGVTGDILNFDIVKNQTPPPNYSLQYYEAALVDEDGSLKIVELPWGPWVEKQRRIRCDSARKPQQIYLRAVYQYVNQFQFSPPSGYDVQPGDELVQLSTGATANVVKFIPQSRGWLIMENIDSTWSNDLGSITVAGKSARQNSFLHPTHDDEVTVELRSEWSEPMEVTPSTGAVSVTASATKTTCLQGEAVVLTVETSGFDVLMDSHDLHFEWGVDKTGEQGKFQALDGDRWETEFGASQNKRHQSFSRVWAFAPNTTGPVDVSVTVRDRSGNVASDTITLTAVHPLDHAGGGFADADVYVLSDTQRAVPGASGIPGTPGSVGGNYFAEYESLVAALPRNGEALILIDTNGASGPTAEAPNARDKASDRFVIMPYNNAGVGVDAGTKAVIDFGIRSDSDLLAVYGLELNGPYDATNPYSIARRPVIGIRSDSLTGFTSNVNCDVSGWEYSYKPSPSYVVSDCRSEGAMNFDIYQPDPGLRAITGSRLGHHPESWKETGARADGRKSKGESAPPFTTDHGPYRASRPVGDCGMSKCSFFACVGWTNPGQPTIRSFGGAQHYPHIVHYTELRLEQRAALGFGTSSATPQNFDGPQDLVLDKIVFIAADNTRSQFSFSVGPVTVRNARFVFPDSRPTSIGMGGNSMFSLAKGGAAGQMPQMRTLKQRIVLENITAVSLISDKYFKPTPGYHTSDTCQFVVQDTITNWTNVTTRNNLFHVKHQAVVGDTPNDTGPFDETPRYQPLFQAEYDWDDTMGGTRTSTTTAQEKLAWNRNPANGRIDTSVGIPNTVTATFEPRSGSSAYRTASGSIPYDDILSRVRPTNGTASKGAYDPLAT